MRISDWSSDVCSSDLSARMIPRRMIDDLERLLAGVGLRHDQLVDVDAELARIDGVERMFGIDKGDGAAALLRFGERVERERRLARAFGAIDFDDAAARQAADAEGTVEAERTGRARPHLPGLPPKSEGAP